MSRVDDVNAEQRAEEIRRAEIRQAEKQDAKKKEEASAFDRAMADKTSQQSASGTYVEKARQAARDSRDRSEASVKDEVVGSEKKSGEEKGRKTEGAKKSESQLVLDRRLSMLDPKLLKSAEANRQASKDAAAQTPSKEPSKSEENRQKGIMGGAGKTPGRVEAKGDDDAGGKNQGQSKDQKEGPFKLPPPALMAPPPLARPRETGDPNLRAFMKEVVDKIVSRVMVGTNAQGQAEFRIELKSTVLKGLTVKVSGGRGGKIRAVFSGSDREVIAALKRSSSSLVDSLRERGLTMEELVFEETGAR